MSGGSTLGKVTKVELLGSDIPIKFVQDQNGLTITPGGLVQPLPEIENQLLSRGGRVFRITHDKGWINDDDPGVVAPGWFRQSNLGTGDFNNDLTISDTPGDVWSCSFMGNSVSVITPKEPGAGKIEIQIDGQTHSIVDLSTTGERKPQQVVCEIIGLTPGNHTISIINYGDGRVAIDALIVQ